MRNLLYVLSTTILCLTVQTSNAQCKTKIDEFTKDTLTSSEYQKLGKNKNGFSDYAKFLRVQTFKTNSTFSLLLQPEFRNVETVKKGTTVYIKFQNDSIMQLSVTETSVSDHRKGEAFTQGTETTVWYNSLWFDLTPSQLLELEANKIKKIRCWINDYDVKPGDADIIQKQIACIKKKKG